MASSQLLPVATLRVGGALAVRYVEASAADLEEPFFGRTIKRLEADRSRARSMTLAHSNARYPDVFIFHVARCGSTLLARLLGAHHDTVAIVESPLIGAALQDPSVSNDELRAVIVAHTAVMSPEHKVSVFKLSHRNHVSWRRLHAIFPDAKFIVLSRSPRPVLESLMHRPPKSLRTIHELEGPEASLREAIRSYAATIESMFEMLAAEADDLSVDYERLTDKDVLQSLLAQLTFGDVPARFTSAMTVLELDAKSMIARPHVRALHPPLPHGFEADIDKLTSRYQDLVGHERFGATAEKLALSPRSSSTSSSRRAPLRSRSKR